MLTIHLHRNLYRSAAGYTIGELLLDECGYLCDTLEDEDRGLTQEMPVSMIQTLKVYGQTAIPKGTYRVRMEVVSPKLKNKAYARKYGGCLPRLENVPGWEGVLIHPFNTAEESLGCIGPGVYAGGGRIKDSTKAFYDLMDFYLVPAHKRGEAIWITIE